MADEQDPPVGYCSPPKHSQFKKGGPQPHRRRKADKMIDAYALLNEPVKIGEGRGARKVETFEVSLIKLCNKAIPGDMRAAELALTYFHQYGVIGARATESACPGMLFVPYDHDPDDWHEKFEKYGPPPWPFFEHDGISRLQELRDAHQLRK